MFIIFKDRLRTSARTFAFISFGTTVNKCSLLEMLNEVDKA